MHSLIPTHCNNFISDSIKMTFFNTVYSILNIGNNEDQPRIEKFRTIVVNVIAVLTAIIVFLYLILFIKTARFGMAMLFALFALASLFPLYTNKLGYHVFSRIVIISITITIIYFTVILVGFQSDVHTILIILVTCIPIILDNKKIVASFVIIIIILYFLANFYLETHGPLNIEAKIKYSNFINFIFAISASTFISTVVLNEVRIYINQIRDSNDLLKEKNKELTSKNEQIKLQNRNLELFTSVASHDLRTPLRTISSFVGLIRKNISKGPYDPKIEEYLNYVQDGSKQMNSLINSIAEVNRLNKDETEQAVIINLKTLLEEMTIHFNKELYKNFIIECDILPTVQGKKSHFYNLFQNLIENAWKYNKSKNKKVIIKYQKFEDRFTISFIDNGIGIQKDYLTQIFNPFTKLHSNIEYDGSGMGLSICKSIVEIYKGTIEALPNKPKGSKFVITLPNQILAKHPMDIRI